MPPATVRILSGAMVTFAGVAIAATSFASPHTNGTASGDVGQIPMHVA